MKNYAHGKSADGFAPKREWKSMETEPSMGKDVVPHNLTALAERIAVARLRRAEFLPNELFAEPAWDMLIALYQSNVVGYRMTVTNLCNDSRVPPTTALRWLDKLIELGIARRMKNPLDGRIIFVELEAKGQAAMRKYMSHIWALFYG